MSRKERGPERRFPADDEQETVDDETGTKHRCISFLDDFSMEWAVDARRD